MIRFLSSSFLRLLHVLVVFGVLLYPFTIHNSVSSFSIQSQSQSQQQQQQQQQQHKQSVHPHGCRNSCLCSTNSIRCNPHQKKSRLCMLPLVQVISDVDDTLKSSGGVKLGDIPLGGIDTQYAREEIYPGVMQFILELSLFPLKHPPRLRPNRRDDRRTSSTLPPKTNNSAIPPPTFMNPIMCPPKVAILTARAEEFKAALELKDDSKLGQAFLETGEKAGVRNWGLGPVLYGSVAEWVIQERKGLRKFSNFERLLQQDPTGTILQYIYVGDTGELDQEAGETMLREYPEVVKAVFLHVVSERPYPTISPPKLINGRPVVFFRTYVGAAAIACQLGLMDAEGMMKVVSIAEEALENVPRSSDKWQDLYRDVREAYRTLKAYS